MGVRRRDFLLLATLAAAAACVMAAFGQAVTPAVRPTGSGAQSAASIPDFSGIWSHPYFPGFEPPASGPGPVTNRLRLRGGPQRGVGDPRQLVGDYTNPILKPQAAEVVKKHGETELSGVGSPTPTNQCWPEPVPYIFWKVVMRMLQQPDEIIILYGDEVRHVRMIGCSTTTTRNKVWNGTQKRIFAFRRMRFHSSPTATPTIGASTCNSNSPSRMKASLRRRGRRP